MRCFFSAVAISTLMSLPLRAQPTAAEISRYPHGEAEHVYRAVLDNVFRSDGSPGTIVLYDSLGHAFAHVDTLKPGVFRYPAGFDRAAFRNFLRVTSTAPHPHGMTEFALAPLPRFTYAVPVTRITGDEMIALRTSTHSDTVLYMRNGSEPMLIHEEPFWTAFQKRYPGSWGYTVLTRVGFNDDVTNAFVQIMHRCYTECTSVESVFLRKTDNRWIVENRFLHPDQSVEGFPPGGLRYVGKGGWMRAANERVEIARRKEVADSLRREKSPRRIRGHVVNVSTGRGMAGHPVYQLLGRDNNPDRVATTDSEGRFTISNPAVGGWYLTVQCDETFDIDRSLAGAGFYLGPGVDTTIVFEARSLSPCWKPRIHPLQSGEAESPEYASSKFPDSTDASVYGVIIQSMFSANSRRPLLLGQTRGRCLFNSTHCEGFEHLSILVREGVLDSATYRSFTRPSHPLARFNTAFAHRHGFMMLTPAVLDFVSKQTGDAGPEMDSYWDPESHLPGLQRAYPNADGIVSFTRVSYSPDSTQALATVNWQRTPDDGSRRTFLLERSKESWRVIRQNLEADALTAELQAGSCVIARGGTAFPRSDHARLRGHYSFVFVDTNGRTERKILDVSKFLSWHPEDSWDGSLDHKLLRVRKWDGERLFGTWQDIGIDAIPIDQHRNRIPEISGHFCATRSEQ